MGPHTTTALCSPSRLRFIQCMAWIPSSHKGRIQGRTHPSTKCLTLPPYHPHKPKAQSSRQRLNAYIQIQHIYNGVHIHRSTHSIASSFIPAPSGDPPFPAPSSKLPQRRVSHTAPCAAVVFHSISDTSPSSHRLAPTRRNCSLWPMGPSQAGCTGQHSMSCCAHHHPSCHRRCCQGPEASYRNTSPKW